VRNLRIFSLLILFALVGIWTARKFSPNDLGQVEEINWNQLAIPPEGAAFEELKLKIERPVKIAGFVVPLSDSFQRITEFLLVPDSMSCIHVPPPPPNQMILVRFENPIEPQLAFGPVWVSGRLVLQSEKHSFGTAIYSMVGANIVPYKSNAKVSNFKLALDPKLSP
jgi:hypothetical protein